MNNTENNELQSVLGDVIQILFQAKGMTEGATMLISPLDGVRKIRSNIERAIKRLEGALEDKG